MAKITGLPDLGHDWKPVRVDDGPLQYDCRCLLRSPVPYNDSFCPDAVIDYANRLVAEERAKTRALLEGLRDQLRADAAHLDSRSSSTTSANHHKAEQARKDARRLDEALTILPGSDR